MILYHGSYMEVRNPDLTHSRKSVDFGSGFYTTPIKDQAVNWCRKFQRQGKNSVISRYCFDESSSCKLKILQFESYSETWLDFILACRTDRDVSDYDLVIGGVANDKVFNTVELYFDQLIGKREAIKRLTYEKPNLQYCFRTEAALKYLNFEGRETL